MRPKYFHKYVGGNFRIDALQAAILHVKLAYLDKWTEGRQRNAALYRGHFAAKGLEGRVVLPAELPKRRHVYNQFIIRFPEGRETRDRVLNTLRAAEIGCDIYYPLTLPDQECFRALPSAQDQYPESRAAAEQSLAIPIFPELRPEQIEEVVDTIGKGLN
jgi:dTDP-4-amino-4,6-dideoxygalactose transaminase